MFGHTLFRNRPSKRLLKRRVAPIVERRHEVGDFLYGSECQFYEIGGVGFKLYHSENDRDFAYELQEYASEHGLGPDVYGKLDVRRKFGYFTEVAQEVEYFGHDEEQSLLRELSDIGMWHIDMKTENVGMLHGEIVVIDFGPLGARLQ
jgi:hypothetical protein